MEWLKVAQYAKRYGQSPRHVRRLIGEGKLEAFKPTGSGTWRIALQEKDRPTLGDDRAHQDVIADLLESASLEVRAILIGFPKVWRFSYRPDDPSNGLGWISDSYGHHVEMNFNVESLPGWPSAIEHLAEGLPNAHTAWREIKRSIGEYWQRVAERESHYTDEAAALLEPESAAVSLDTSRFYRSILAEVDEPCLRPTANDYEVVKRRPDRVLVTMEGAGILSAADEVDALRWRDRHLEWRRNFVYVYKPRLIDLREGVIAATRNFVEAVEDVLIRGRVPGRCERCPDEPKND